MRRRQASKSRGGIDETWARFNHTKMRSARAAKVEEWRQKNENDKTKKWTHSCVHFFVH